MRLTVSPHLLRRLLVLRLLLLDRLRLTDSFLRRRERFIGFPVDRYDLGGTGRVVGRRLPVEILELIPRDIGEGNRRGDRGQQET
jgi:hypothetical protein